MRRQSALAFVRLQPNVAGGNAFRRIYRHNIALEA